MTPAELRRIAMRHADDDTGAFAPAGALNHGHGYPSAHNDRHRLLIEVDRLTAENEAMKLQLKEAGHG